MKDRYIVPRAEVAVLFDSSIMSDSPTGEGFTDPEEYGGF